MKAPVSPEPAPARASPAGAPSLRQRRQQELRQQLSDAATRMFLERGFDAVRVSDVARACGVTEKTVFNHFPTKESLLSDRWEATTAALCRQLADPARPPVDAALAVLESELHFLTAGGLQTTGADMAQVRRFGELVRSTPALLAHERQALERLSGAAASTLAVRMQTSAGAPEPAIIAAALTGLWTVYVHSLHHHFSSDDAGQVRDGVSRDLRRAAAVLRQGLDAAVPLDDRPPTDA